MRAKSAECESWFDPLKFAADAGRISEADILFGQQQKQQQQQLSDQVETTRVQLPPEDLFERRSDILKKLT
jgi:hypothetical protein